MLKNYEKYYNALFKVIVLAAVLAAIYFAFTYLIPFFAPFVIGLIIAAINEPLIHLLEKRLKIPRRAASVVSLLFSILVLGFLVAIGILKIYNELVYLKENLSSHANTTSTQLTDYINKISSYYKNLPADLTNTINENLKSLAPKLQEIITSLVTYLINTISSIPKLTVFTIVTLLSAYFISSDISKIKEFLAKQVPTAFSKSFSGIKTDTFTALLGYFKALLILMGLTFVEVSTGLFIIGADYALLMGLIVGLSDAIPILGTGVVMVPWIAWNLIVGDIRMALGLGIIYVLGVIIRQILEPKIVGDQIGLHPLVTLIAMYVGLEIFGIIGMFIGPVSIIIIKNLQSSGLIKIWNE
ncbi:MAG: sporulation integral membrane protein YtvI [Clostridia bacterium]|nr:sporulation integral membrane protein YtvI [Clostridia bacterium]